MLLGQWFAYLKREVQEGNPKAILSREVGRWFLGKAQKYPMALQY